MSRKKTHEEYVAQVAEVNPNIEVIGVYVNTHTKIKHKCKIDGCEWDVEPNSILSGYGCPMCANNKKTKTHEQYVREVEKINPDVEVVGKYINKRTKVLHRCKICGYEWFANPSNILTGSKCPECDRLVRSKSHEQYVEELYKVNPNIEVLGAYISNKTKILVRCKIDGFEWEVRPDSILLFGTGCPQCKESHGEKMIDSYLKEHNINFDIQHTFDNCKNVFVLPFDFYLPDYNACIEYDGEQHFRPVEYFGGKQAFYKRIKRDKIKTDYCFNNNISLLRIRYNEDVIEKLDEFFKTL